MEVDLDEVLKDETLLTRLGAATTVEELKAIVRNAPGLKISLDRDITVEFTPIQIGFGFSLNGVGGLAGFNRTMRLDPLRDGIGFLHQRLQKVR